MEDRSNSPQPSEDRKRGEKGAGNIGMCIGEEVARGYFLL
jgi:hypothetical protein